MGCVSRVRPIVTLLICAHCVAAQSEPPEEISKQGYWPPPAWEHRVRHRGLSEISEGALGPLQPRRYMRIKGKFLGGATPRPAWRLLENASKGRPECGPRPRGAAPPGERTAYAAISLGFPAVMEIV